MEPEREAFLRAIANEPENYLHHWVFADWLDERGEHDEAARHRAFEAADRWLRELVPRLGETCTNYDESADAYFRGGTQVHEVWVPITYDDMITAGRDYVTHGDRFVQQGSDTAGSMLSDPETRKEFWACWSVVTGVEVPASDHLRGPFTCSC